MLAYRRERKEFHSLIPNPRDNPANLESPASIGIGRLVTMKHKEASQAKKASKAGAGIENLFLALPLGLILEQGGEAVSKDEKG